MTDRPPSVTAVVSTFPTPSQTFILRKLQGLRDAGVAVTVAATDIGPDAGALGFPTMPLAPWRTPARSLVRSTRPTRAALTAGLSGLAGRDRRWRARIVQAPLTAADTDIIHFEFSGIAITYLDAIDALRRDHRRHHRIVVSCRGAAEQIEPFRDPDRAAGLAEVFARADLIHCVSDDMRATVESFGAPAAKILVNRPAVPVADFAPLRRSGTGTDGPLRVLCIGRLHWKKGLDDALRAMAALRARGRDAELRIVGEGPEREKLTFVRHTLGLADRVTLLGSRSQAEVREQLAWADVLLLPSLSEGISNAVLEAMAAGRAVVTTDCGGMLEVVTDGRDGLVVGVADVEAMADRLALLADDPDLRARLGTAAAARAEVDLDLSRQVRLFLDAYRTLDPSWSSSGSPDPGTDGPNAPATSATSRSDERPSR